jgi:hypothetical protein
MKTPLDPSTLTREAKLNLIYRHTHRDYKGSGKGPARTILVYRGGTALVLLDNLTEDEINLKLPGALKSEEKRLTKPEWFARDDDSMRNGSAFRVAGARKFAHYINGDYMGMFEDYEYATYAAGVEMKPYTKKEGKALLPANMGGNVGF